MVIIMLWEKKSKEVKHNRIQLSFSVENEFLYVEEDTVQGGQRRVVVFYLQDLGRREGGDTEKEWDLECGLIDFVYFFIMHPEAA